MGASCAAVGCTNHRKKKPNLAFHILPKDRKTKEAWLANVKREGDVPKDENFFICEEHFEKGCYERDLKSELLGIPSKLKKLKRGSIPTIFAHKYIPQKRLHSFKRAATTEKKAYTASVTTLSEPDYPTSSSTQIDADTDSVSSQTECEMDDDYSLPSEEEIMSAEIWEENIPVSDDTKFIVYWSQLKELLTCCSKCGKNAKIIAALSNGSCLKVKTVCSLEHHCVWSSQPTVGKTAIGNLEIAAAILFTGNTYGRVSDICNALKLSLLGKTLFYKLQKTILFPVINKHYELCKTSVFTYMKTLDNIDLAGDGRCDSPGYNAKYGTYTFMILPTNQIVNFTVTQVTEVANSNALEKHGFLTTLQEIESEVSVRSITTDRHIQIRAYLNSRDDIEHQFDIWHVAKSIKKKLVKYRKTHPELLPWIRSILNHFWWACRTCAGDVQLLREKWCSLLNHIVNKHKWEGNEKFNSCEHPKLSGAHAKDVKWLKYRSPAYICLESIVLDKSLIRDLQYCAEYHHTGMLEVYHSLLTKYCPKREHFQLPGMIARTQLAVLDHNNNLNRKQAKTKRGDPKFRYPYSKVSQNWVAKPVLEQKDMSHLHNMMEDVRVAANVDLTLDLPVTANVPKNIAPTPRPSIESLKFSSSRL